MRQKLVAWLRTVVPGLWAALVAWLAGLGVPEVVLDAAGGLVGMLLVPVTLAVVYGLLRWAETWMPPWLARVLLGSPHSPSYRLPS